MNDTVRALMNNALSGAGESEKEWVSKSGLPCFALRHPSLGHWCGYVGVPSDHPAFGKDYDSAGDFEVHGGLTYAENHLPQREPDGRWWLGFDCAHLGDYVPHLLAGPPRGGDTFKDLSFVEAECERLANQLKD